MLIDAIVTYSNILSQTGSNETGLSLFTSCLLSFLRIRRKLAIFVNMEISHFLTSMHKTYAKVCIQFYHTNVAYKCLYYRDYNLHITLQNVIFRKFDTTVVFNRRALLSKLLIKYSTLYMKISNKFAFAY